VSYWSKLCEAFKRGGHARSFKCKYHDGRHYQDEVITDKSTTMWLLHGHPIAILTRYDDHIELELSTLGYNTVTTISRLNFILNCMKIDNVEFRLKYDRIPGYAVYSYVVYNGKTYRTNTIKIVVNGENVDVIVDEKKEIEFIMHNKKLEYLRKLYNTFSKKTAEIDELLKKIENYDSEYENIIADAKMLIEESGSMEKYGLPWGLYKTYSYEDVKEHIKMLIERADEIIENLKLALTTQELFPQ